MAAADDKERTRESGFLSEIAFCEQYSDGRPGLVCKWDSMIFGTKAWGPYQGLVEKNPGDPDCIDTAFKAWVDTVVVEFEKKQKLSKLVSRSFQCPEPPEPFYVDPSKSEHEFVI